MIDARRGLHLPEVVEAVLAGFEAGSAEAETISRG